MWSIIALSLIGAIVQSDDSPELRLPNFIRPNIYDLTIITYIHDYNVTFDGIVKITINVLNDTNTITLNSDSLDIDKNCVVITNCNGKYVKVSDVSLDQNTTRMFVHSSEILKSGNEYVLSIPFKGIFPNYYIWNYADSKTNQTKMVIVTDFEPIDARTIYPCIDQLEFKARFKVSIGHSKNLTSFSNTELIKTTPMTSLAEYVIDEFKESVLMSTYLVVLMISEFIYVEIDNYKNKVKMGIIVRPELVNRIDYTKKYAPLYLKYHEDYFQQPFPLSKIDFAAIPNLYIGGGEYFGLITLKEASLLVDSGVYSLDDIADAEDDIAFNLAQQWFGNLVTMNWWDTFWIKQGFASYSSICAVNSVHSDWNYMEIITFLNFINVMRDDSLGSSLPLTKQIYNLEELESIYANLDYAKIFYIFYMLNMLLGKETVKQGIVQYISKYKFSTASDDDLWSILTEVAHRENSLNKKMSVNEIMKTWTHQSGYPVLHAIRDHVSQKVTLSQEWYLSDGSLPDNRSWYLPLTMTTSKKPDFNQMKPMLWLIDKTNHTISMSNDVKWFIFNLRLAGIYRVKYDYCTWMSLISVLNNPKEYEVIHPLNRVQLISDSLAFSFINILDYQITLKLIKYLQYEEKYAPWRCAMIELQPINDLLKRTTIYPKFQSFRRILLTKMYNRYGNLKKEVKGYEEIDLKDLINQNACYYLIMDCVTQCKRIFDDWMNSPDPDKDYAAIVPKDYGYLVCREAIINGGIKQWEFLYNRYVHSNDESQKFVFFETLCCTSDPSLQNRLLNWTIGENATIYEDDAWKVFRFLIQYNGLDVAKEFLYQHISDIYDIFKPDITHYVAYYVDAIGKTMKTEEELIEIQQFINTNLKYLNGSESILTQTIKTINTNINWMKNNYMKIGRFLENNSS